MTRLRENYEHWRFFADHPLPWEIGTGSPGTWVEDANHEVLWRFDHFNADQVRRFVSSLNDIVSVEEAPYIRGYNRGWNDALAGCAVAALLALLADLVSFRVENDAGECSWCEAVDPVRTTDHRPTCPWRRAQEIVQRTTGEQP